MSAGRTQTHVDLRGKCHLVDLRAMLGAGTTVHSLDLSENYKYKPSNYVMQGLADVLLSNTTLRCLNLSSNNMGNDGAIMLANALAVNQGLCMLGLRDNRISYSSIPALAEALRTNSTLTELDLSENRIYSDGARALLIALKDNTTLTKLELRNSTDYIDDDILNSIRLYLERNTCIKQLSNAVEKKDVKTRLNVLAALKSLHPLIDHPDTPQPLELVNVYRDYSILHPGDLSPKAAIALLTGPNSYTNYIPEANKALASYLFINALSFPEEIQKNCFRMILWLLRDNLHDEDVAEIIAISTKGAMGAIDDSSCSLASAALPNSQLNPAEIKGLEDDKQIIINQLISILAPEDQLFRLCDKFVTQITTLSSRFANNHFVNESKLRLYSSSNAPEAITHLVLKELSDFLALPESSKFTIKTLTQLEDVLRNRLLLDERSQFHNGDNKYASEIAELKTTLAMIAKIKDLKQPQVLPQAQLESAQQLLVQQIVDLSKCAEGRLSTDLAHLLGYLALPNSTVGSDVLARLEETLSRRRGELAMQPQPSDSAAAQEQEHKLNADEHSKLRSAAAQEHALFAIQARKLFERYPLLTIYGHGGVGQLRELTRELNKGVRHCRALKTCGQLAILDDTNGKLNQYTELVTDLKEVMQRWKSVFDFRQNDAITHYIREVNGIDALLDELTKLIAEIEEDARVCRSRLHSYGPPAQEAAELAKVLEGKRNRLTWLIIEIEAGLNQLAELEDVISRQRLRNALSFYYLGAPVDTRNLQENLTKTREILNERRHYVLSRKHHRSAVDENETREIDDVESAITSIDKLIAYAIETNALAAQKRMFELVKINRRANEVDRLAAIPPTIAEIKRLQAEVNVEHALGQEHESLIKQIAELSKSTQRGKGEFSLTIFTASAKTSVESMRKTYDAYLTKEPDAQLTVTSLDQLANALQARSDFVSVASRRQYHEAEITLLGQVIQTVTRIKQIQSTGAVPVVSAASAVAAPVVVSASLAPPRAGM